MISNLPAVQKFDLHLCPLSFFQNHVRRSLYPILLLSGHIRGYINMNIYIHLHTQENDVGKLPRGERGLNGECLVLNSTHSVQYMSIYMSTWTNVTVILSGMLSEPTALRTLPIIG